MRPLVEGGGQVVHITVPMPRWLATAFSEIEELVARRCNMSLDHQRLPVDRGLGGDGVHQEACKRDGMRRFG